MAGITFAIPADEVIDTMGEIGREMDVRYRETAGGGLAATPTGRRLARERMVQIKRGLVQYGLLISTKTRRRRLYFSRRA